MQATKLQTNHLTAPIGMGTGPLFLSWQCTDGMRQTTYEIEVTANNKTVWQSGKVQSSAMHADTPAVADSRVRGACPFCAGLHAPLSCSRATGG